MVLVKNLVGVTNCTTKHVLISKLEYRNSPYTF